MISFYRFIIATLSLALVLSLWQRGKEEREKTNAILETYMAQEAAMMVHTERMEGELRYMREERENRNLNTRTDRLSSKGRFTS